MIHTERNHLILKGDLSSMGILIEQSVMVSGIVYVFMGLAVCDWSCAIELANYGRTHLGH